VDEKKQKSQAREKEARCRIGMPVIQVGRRPGEGARWKNLEKRESRQERGKNTTREDVQAGLPKRVVYHTKG